MIGNPASGKPDGRAGFRTSLHECDVHPGRAAFHPDSLGTRLSPDACPLDQACDLQAAGRNLSKKCRTVLELFQVPAAHWFLIPQLFKPRIRVGETPT